MLKNDIIVFTSNETGVITKVKKESISYSLLENGDIVSKSNMKLKLNEENGKLKDTENERHCSRKDIKHGYFFYF